MAFTEYAQFDGLGLAELVRRGDVTPRELVEEAITRIEATNPALNAVVYPMYEQARERAAALGRSPNGAAPFHGVPFLLKDLLGDYAGVPTTSGCRFMKGNTAGQDATLVTRYKTAGLIPVGKTNTPECGILPTTEPVLYGPARNPWNTAHSTGGSSGGSAAAVAAGIVPIAHANDGGGSIRIPASCCGLVGMKPTRARNPLGPVIGDAMGGLVAEHVVSRTVRDSAAVLDQTHGPETGDPYWAPPVGRPFLDEVRTAPGRLRIAFATRAFDGERLHPECVTAIERTATLCGELGHTVEEASPPVNQTAIIESFMQVWAAGIAMVIEAFGMLHGQEPREEDFEGLTWSLYQRGRATSAPQYQIAHAMLQLMARQVAQFHETYDCWMVPTLGTPPVALGTIDVQERDIERAFAPIHRYVPFTPLENATGQPAISLPLHWSADGLPVGVMFVGRFGDEATLYRVAAQLEEARPWIERKPPVWDRKETP